MTESEFIKNLDLDIEITEDILDKLRVYKDFLIEYNNHTNLTAITKEEDIYLKHFYDSLTITKAVNLNMFKTLIDIGTGAGFPGMVLKIFYPHLEITLIDSNNKKTKFLEKLKEKLGTDVNIVNERVEEYAKKHLNEYDIVTSRAVANLRVLSEISLPLVKEKGFFIPLKGKLDDTLEDSLDTINIMNGNIISRFTFDLYGNNGERNIIVVCKNKKTEFKELRSYAQILKKPLQKNGK